MTNCIGFPPIARDDARVLILGSLPGEESLGRGQYYGKVQNAFWRIMGALVGASPELAYEDRLQHLKDSKIALWDVCASADRITSLDSMIQIPTVVPNDFASFFAAHLQIGLLCFNGQPAAKLFSRLVLPTLPSAYADIPRIILPSTSPAHAGMRFEDKLSRWRAALNEFSLAL